MKSWALQAVARVAASPNAKMDPVSRRTNSPIFNLSSPSPGHPRLVGENSTGEAATWIRRFHDEPPCRENIGEMQSGGRLKGPVNSVRTANLFCAIVISYPHAAVGGHRRPGYNSGRQAVVGASAALLDGSQEIREADLRTTTMMKLLVLGVDSVVGANLALSWANHYAVCGLFRRQPVALDGCSTARFDPKNEAAVQALMRQESPGWIVYCGPFGRGSWDVGWEIPDAEVEARLWPAWRTQPTRWAPG